MITWTIIGLYMLSMSIVCLFSLGQLNLAIHYLRNSNGKEKRDVELTSIPMVTIQLPVFNEKYVVARLIRAVAQIEYPVEKLEIQVLDDSTDETSQIIIDTITEFPNHNILHIQRKERKGFKAGALQYGLKKAKGAFIAIFDADFLPTKDFLFKTLPAFSSDNIGMVQTRWGHINEDYSLLTRMQAFGLNAHFTVEQSGRQAAGSFINFNGTGGVWRRECIDEAGGWQHDTLTEDLDLSYRAQLKGWKFQYLEQVVSPAELPVLIPAIKSQQFRWNKGAAETARKNLGQVLKSDLNPIHKYRATMHLLNSSVFLFILVAALLSIPMLYLKENNSTISLIFDIGSIFILGFLAIGIFYWVATSAIETSALKKFSVRFPLFLTFSMGMALHNSVAILEGLLRVKSPFVRTPKFNIKDKGDQLKKNSYLTYKVPPITWIEGLLAGYFVFGIWSGITLQDYGLILFHAMLAIGFGYVFFVSVKPNTEHAS